MFVHSPLFGEFSMKLKIYTGGLFDKDTHIMIEDVLDDNLFNDVKIYGKKMEFIVNCHNLNKVPFGTFITEFGKIAIFTSYAFDENRLDGVIKEGSDYEKRMKYIMKHVGWNRSIKVDDEDVIYDYCHIDGNTNMLFKGEYIVKLLDGFLRLYEHLYGIPTEMRMSDMNRFCSIFCIEPLKRMVLESVFVKGSPFARFRFKEWRYGNLEVNNGDSIIAVETNQKIPTILHHEDLMNEICRVFDSTEREKISAHLNLKIIGQNNDDDVIDIIGQGKFNNGISAENCRDIKLYFGPGVDNVVDGLTKNEIKEFVKMFPTTDQPRMWFYFVRGLKIGDEVRLKLPKYMVQNGYPKSCPSDELSGNEQQYEITYDESTYESVVKRIG